MLSGSGRQLFNLHRPSTVASTSVRFFFAQCTNTVHIQENLRWFNVVCLNVANAAPDTDRNGVGDSVSSCDERENGNYASPSGCSDYVTCTDGEYVINTCADNLFWDDAVRRCEFTTSTCTNGQ